jgi:hypothetical protein
MRIQRASLGQSSVASASATLSGYQTLLNQACSLTASSVLLPGQSLGVAMTEAQMQSLTKFQSLYETIPDLLAAAQIVDASAGGTTNTQLVQCANQNLPKVFSAIEYALPNQSPVGQGSAVQGPVNAGQTFAQAQVSEAAFQASLSQSNPVTQTAAASSNSSSSTSSPWYAWFTETSFDSIPNWALAAAGAVLVFMLVGRSR